MEQVRKLWGRLAPEIPLWDLKTGDDIMTKALAPQRLAASLFAAFGLLAVLLAMVGLYSLTASIVTRRTREIGIRIAIGALPGVIVRRILVRGLLVAIAGLVVGTGTAMNAARFAAPMIREVPANDLVTLLAVTALVLVVSILATLAPAIRAARVDPVVALRVD